MPDIYLLPDTNVFLHFPPISDVDWLALAGSQVVNLAIAPVISRELNDHKDAPRSRKFARQGCVWWMAQQKTANRTRNRCGTEYPETGSNSV